MYHHDKRQAQALIGHALEARGWKIFGYKEDRSDLQSDYWDPESWDGIATLGEYVACVGVSEYEVKAYSGKPIEKRTPQQGGTCERCAGSGNDPSGWTLEQARAEPRKYNLEQLLLQYPGSTALPDTGGPMGVRVRTAQGHEASKMMADVVSPIPFHDSGPLKCVKCHGTGKDSAKPKIEIVDHYPKFQANPPRCNWHLERDGKILASGTGFATVLRELGNRCSFEDKVIAGDVIAGKIVAAMFADAKTSWNAIKEKEKQPMKTESTVAEPEVAAAPAFTIRNGTREGYVEILFAAKPDAATISNLKAAKFRFTCSNGEPRWFGLKANLPAAYLNGEVADRPASEPAPDKDPDPDAGAIANPNAGADETDEPEPETEEGEAETNGGEGETDDAEAEAEEEAKIFGAPTLHKVEALRCNPNVFNGQRAGKDSAYITDGKMLFVKKFVTTKFKTKHRTAKDGRYNYATNPVPDSSMDLLVKSALNKEPDEAQVLGYTDKWEHVYEGRTDAAHLGIVRMANGKYLTADAEYLKFFDKHLDYDTIRASKPECPLVYMKGEKVAGLLMPVGHGPKTQKVEKFLKAAGIASATPPKGRERKAAAPATPAAPAQPAQTPKVTPLPLPLTASLALIRGALNRMKVKA